MFNVRGLEITRNIAGVPQLLVEGITSERRRCECRNRCHCSHVGVGNADINAIISYFPSCVAVVPDWRYHTVTNCQQISQVMEVAK